MAPKASLKIPVLYPTMDDINRPFEEFIAKHEKRIGAVGLAKIVPPAGWSPRPAGRRSYEELPDVTIERCIKQVATGSKGLYRFLLVEQKPMSLKDSFKPLALHDDQQPGTSDPSEVERKYWRTVGIRPPLYGADIHGSLFDKKCKGWTLKNLNTVLSKTLEECGHDLPGVSSPYLYYGMWRSTFAWHCEDLDLYSVNYLHYGAPKHWYCIPPAHRQRFENLLKGLLPDLFKACPEFMRHKELLISPQMLDLHQIPYVRAVQHPREFMINFPGAYHAGFNAGFNCAESVNFGTKHWIAMGARAGVCKCSEDSVKIDMRLFRHLVPSRLLPPELLEDTDEDDESEEVEDVKKSTQRCRQQAASFSGRGRRGGAGVGRDPLRSSGRGQEEDEDENGKRVRRARPGETGSRGRRGMTGPSASGRGGGRRTRLDEAPFELEGPIGGSDADEEEEEEVGGGMRSDDEEFVLDEEDVKAAELELAAVGRSGSRSRPGKGATDPSSMPRKRPRSTTAVAARSAPASAAATRPSGRLSSKKDGPSKLSRPSRRPSLAISPIIIPSDNMDVPLGKRSRRAKVGLEQEYSTAAVAPSQQQGRTKRVVRQPARGDHKEAAAPSVVAPATPVPGKGSSPVVRLSLRKVTASKRNVAATTAAVAAPQPDLVLGPRSSRRTAARKPSVGQYRQYAEVGVDDADDSDASLDDEEEEEEDDIIEDSDVDEEQTYGDVDDDDDVEDSEEEEAVVMSSDSDDDDEEEEEEDGTTLRKRRGARTVAGAARTGPPPRPHVKQPVVASAKALVRNPLRGGGPGGKRRVTASVSRGEPVGALIGRKSRKVRPTWKVAEGLRHQAVTGSDDDDDEH